MVEWAQVTVRRGARVKVAPPILFTFHAEDARNTTSPVQPLRACRKNVVNWKSTIRIAI